MNSMKRRGVLAMSILSPLFGLFGFAAASKNGVVGIGEFRDLVIAALKKQPGVDDVARDMNDPAKLTFVMGTDSSTVDVTNSYGHFIAYPDESIDSAIDMLVRATMDAKLNVVSEDSIVAVNRSGEYIDHIKGQGAEILSESLAADLFITYMVDRPNSMKTLAPNDVHGKDLPSLRKLALDNMRKWLSRVVADNGLQLGVLYYVEDNVLLSTSLILFEEFWKSIEGRFPGDVLIALPRRDQLFIFDDGNPKAKALARHMIDVSISENFNLLSPKLYARRGGKFLVVSD